MKTFRKLTLKVSLLLKVSFPFMQMMINCRYSPLLESYLAFVLYLNILKMYITITDFVGCLSDLGKGGCHC